MKGFCYKIELNVRYVSHTELFYLEFNSFDTKKLEIVIADTGRSPYIVNTDSMNGVAIKPKTEFMTTNIINFFTGWKRVVSVLIMEKELNLRPLLSVLQINMKRYSKQSWDVMFHGWWLQVIHTYAVVEFT